MSIEEGQNLVLEQDTDFAGNMQEGKKVRELSKTK